MYFVYIIENSVDKSWYIGFTTSIKRRIEEHNSKSGGEYSKKKLGKWKLIYLEGYIEKLDALGREKFLKSGSGRSFIKRQIKNYLNNNLPA